MDPKTEKQLAILANVYRQAALEIVSDVSRMVQEGTSTRHKKAALKSIEEILKEVDEFSDTWIEQNIPRAYRQGWDGAFQNQFYSTPEGFGAEINYRDFAKINREAVEVVAYNLQDDLQSATEKVGRQVRGIFREVGLEETQRRLISGEALAETRAAMKEKFVSQGVTAFKDKLGRNWSLDSYCEMVARTTTREATTAGTINRLRSGGYDLVQISEHQPTCELCIGLGGKVFSLSGDDSRYPRYQGYIPKHPRCLHVLWSYQEQFDPNPEATRRKSNTSLTEDTRTEAEKRAYKATQDVKRKQRDLREQYKRYMARLGEKEVGRIQDFARSKKAGSERWEELQDLYRAAGREMKR